MYPRDWMVEPLLEGEVDTEFQRKEFDHDSKWFIVYSMKQGFLPLMEKMYTDRVKYKKMMIEEQKKR